MTVREVTLSEIEPVWREWEEKDDSISPFAYFDYVKHLYREERKWVLLSTPRIMVLFDDDNTPLLIAPLKKHVLRRRYKMLGDRQGCAVAQFLFLPSLDKERRLQCISALLEALHGRYVFRRLAAGDELTLYMAAHAREAGVAKCLACNLEDNETGRSKSVRQNIRTAYNRLQRDGRRVEWRMLLGGEMTDSVWKEMMALYLKRLFDKYKHKPAPLRAYYKWRYMHVKHDTFSLRQSSNTRHALLYIDGRLAAFLSTFENHSHTRLVMPHLAIDDTFGFYSPGYVLLNETMRYLLSETSVRSLDMTRGTEKYKYDFCGYEYLTYNYTL